MKPNTSFEIPGSGYKGTRLVWVVYYGPRSDRRVKFGMNKAEAEKIGREAIASPHVDHELPSTWPDAFFFDRALVRPWIEGRRYIANGQHTIYERP